MAWIQENKIFYAVHVMSFSIRLVKSPWLDPRICCKQWTYLYYNNPRLSGLPRVSTINYQCCLWCIFVTSKYSCLKMNCWLCTLYALIMFVIGILWKYFNCCKPFFFYAVLELVVLRWCEDKHWSVILYPFILLCGYYQWQGYWLYLLCCFCSKGT